MRGRGGGNIIPSVVVVDCWVKAFSCPNCGRPFTRKDVMVRHTKRRICGRRAALRTAGQATGQLGGQTSVGTQAGGSNGAFLPPSPLEGISPTVEQHYTGQNGPAFTPDALPTPEVEVAQTSSICPLWRSPQHPAAQPTSFEAPRGALSTSGDMSIASQVGAYLTSQTGRSLQQPAPFLEPPTYPSAPPAPFSFTLRLPM
ncbi:hypothetical protein M427DRAFT_146091 [Gonapodya prolifera JEL478]|uniref:C2H2-type domain-containing protein n=1 Tax=Gonapodya prolifera (strain JEL478) TaxID=1344416 RepID=A0A139ABW2_GONPJ|nr:hypothetical protein M427DRAFT_146091 [Gonapodya prolifera JEL478]|eukprot:KXS14291.1 hypothetical protein M427DRAFT_146091 [Gonapodya prolifera JEL478]